MAYNPLLVSLIACLQGVFNSCLSHLLNALEIALFKVYKALKKRPSSKVVSFRLETKLVSELNKKAIAKRVTLSQFIKDIFVDALVEQDIRDDILELHTEVRELSLDIDSLREDTRRLISLLLTELLGWSEKEAQSWMLSPYHKGSKDLLPPPPSASFDEFDEDE